MGRAVRGLVGMAVLAAGLMVGSPASGAVNCFGASPTIVGTGQADNIVGNPGRDVIVALGGQDTVESQGGNDLVCGGAGGDFLDLGDGVDKANGGGGGDDLVDFFRGPITVDLSITSAQNTGEGADRITRVEGASGTPEDDQLFGNALATPGGNGLFGEGGPDEIDGRANVDFISGGAGDDVGVAIYGLDGGTGADFIFGGPGDDELNGEQGDDALSGEEGDDELIGGEADEVIGDFGSGGEGAENEGGDVCSELEDDDGTCETLNPRSSSAAASHPAGSRWAGLRLRWRMVVRAAGTLGA